MRPPAATVTTAGRDSTVTPPSRSRTGRFAKVGTPATTHSCRFFFLGSNQDLPNYLLTAAFSQCDKINPRTLVTSSPCRCKSCDFSLSCVLHHLSLWRGRSAGNFIRSHNLMKIYDVYRQAGGRDYPTMFAHGFAKRTLLIITLSPVLRWRMSRA